MPETWIPKAGPTEKETSKLSFEKWWANSFYVQFHGWQKKDMMVAKKIAFKVWEYQRLQFRQIVIDILDVIKQSH